jgi:hypothetical protein
MEGLPIDGDLSTAILVMLFIALRQVAEIIAKKIPDDATGVLGIVRDFFKMLALYVTNDEGKKDPPA